MDDKLLVLSAPVEKALMSRLFEAIPDACLVTNPIGVIIGASRVAAGLLCSSRKSLSGRRLESFMLPRELPLYVENLKRVRRGERVPEWEVRIKRPGRRRLLHATARVRGISDPKGRVLAVGWSLRELAARRKGGIALGGADAVYRSLTDDVLNIPTVGFLALDPRGRIAWINRTLEGFFNVDEAKLIGRNYMEALRDQLRDLAFDPSDSLARAAAGDEFECHLVDPRTMQERWLKHVTVPTHPGGSFEVYRDITAEKHVQEALLESVSAGALGVEIGAALTSRGRLRGVLRRAARALGQHLNLLAVRVWLLDRRRGGFVPAASFGEDIGFASPRSQAAFDARMPRIDPLNASQIEWAEERGLTWHCQLMCLDHATLGAITALSRQPLSPLSREALHSASDTLALAIQRVRAETQVHLSRMKLSRLSAELRALTERLMTVQDEERRRVSRELHDDLGQTLGVLVMDVGTLTRRAAPLPAAAHESLKQLRDNLVDLSDHVRRVAHQLHPSVLDDLGLVAALESHTREFSRRESIRVDFEAARLKDAIPKQVASCLYRVAQEGLRNVARHAQAGAVRVRLSTTTKWARLSISDSGIGFNPREGSRSDGLGFVSMRERVRMVKGRLIVRSRPGHGTHVLASVPLSPPASGR